MDALIGIEGYSIDKNKTIEVNDARKHSKFSILFKIKEPEIKYHQQSIAVTNNSRTNNNI